MNCSLNLFLITASCRDLTRLPAQSCTPPFRVRFRMHARSTLLRPERLSTLPRLVSNGSQFRDYEREVGGRHQQYVHVDDWLRRFFLAFAESQCGNTTDETAR